MHNITFSILVHFFSCSLISFFLYCCFWNFPSECNISNANLQFTIEKSRLFVEANFPLTTLDLRSIF